MVGTESTVSVNVFSFSGWDANKILSESVVQLKKTNEESYELKIRPGETHMFDNNPFRSLNVEIHHLTILMLKYII